jgi:hypothetical protein
MSLPHPYGAGIWTLQVVADWYALAEIVEMYEPGRRAMFAS